MNDKALHFAAGLALAFLGAAMSLMSPAIAAMLLVVAIGAGKEILDGYTGGTRDYLDFFATVAGGAIVVMIIMAMR